MINIHVDENSITVTGHAERPAGVPPGNNIICAAVSSVTLTLIEGLRQIAGLQIEATTESGDVRISWSRMNDIGKALIDTWLLGIYGIQGSYGNITIV